MRQHYFRQTFQEGKSRLRSLILPMIAIVVLVLLPPSPLRAQQLSVSENSYPPAGWNLLAENLWDTDRWDEDLPHLSSSSSCKSTEGGTYQIVAKASSYDSCIDANEDLFDFAIEVNVKNVSGYGNIQDFLNFRFDKDYTGYSFIIDQIGNYSLQLYDKCKDDEKCRKSNKLANGINAAIHTDPGQSNLMAVVAQRYTFYLYVNHQLVGTVTDSKKTFDHGTIGLEFDNLNPDSPGEAFFSDLKVWAPPAG